jgi:hypothetical protein
MQLGWLGLRRKLAPRFEVQACGQRKILVFVHLGSVQSTAIAAADWMLSITWTPEQPTRRAMNQHQLTRGFSSYAAAVAFAQPIGNVGGCKRREWCLSCSTAQALKWMH